jgi:hypothetical protein
LVMTAPADRKVVMNGYLPEVFGSAAVSEIV